MILETLTINNYVVLWLCEGETVMKHRNKSQKCILNYLLDGVEKTTIGVNNIYLRQFDKQCSNTYITSSKKESK
jgi:hypothetical protein